MDQEVRPSAALYTVAGLVAKFDGAGKQPVMHAALDCSWRRVVFIFIATVNSISTNGTAIFHHRIEPPDTDTCGAVPCRRNRSREYR